MKILIKNLKPRNYLVTLSIKRKAGKHQNKKFKRNKKKVRLDE